MQIDRYSLTEAGVIAGELSTGETVTIEIYDLSDGSAVAVDSDACTEIGSTGTYYFPLSSITTYPTAFTEYHWIMTTSGITTDAGKVTLYDNADMAEGTNQVTCTVLDGSSVAVPSALIQCWNSDQTLLLDRKWTDSLGQVVFALDDGTYKLRCSKLQVSFTVPETLTVSGTTTKAITADVLTIATPADSTTCRVFDYGYNQAGSQPLSTLKAYATITALPMSASNKLHVGSKVTATYDPSNGMFFFDIVQGAVCLFKCDDLGISYTRTVPSSATARLSSIAA